MADAERDKMLRDMAENRGCKLVKSRRRKPGTGDYGRYGLKDSKSGQEVFGFGDKGLTASAEEIEAWLRGGAIAEWKRSLKAAAGVPKTEAKAKSQPKPANDEDREGERKAVPKRAPAGKQAAAPPPPAPSPPPPSPPPPPPPPPKPKRVVREAKPGDAEKVAALVTELGYPVEAAEMKRRLARAARAGEPLLVVDEGGVSGCLSWHVWTALHRPKPVGRITLLVVGEKARFRGLGAALMAEAEARFRKAGCGLIEVTSNIKRLGAHDFYRRQGYERTSWRFGKRLDEGSGDEGSGSGNADGG